MLTKRRPGRPTVDDPGAPSSLGRRIRQARQALGLSLAAVAGDVVSRMLHRPLPLELRTRAQLILAAAYLRQGRPEPAKPVLEEAIDVAERSPWPHLLVDLYDRLGSVYYLLRHAHAAGQWFERAIERYQSASLKDPGLKARVLGHRANLHYVAGQPAEAIAAYESAIAAAEEVLDMSALAGIYEGLALSLRQTGQYHRALAYP